MVLGTSRRIAIFKVATLQRQAHLQSCNVPFSGSNSIKFRRGAGCPFQRVRVSGGHLCVAEATTEPVGETSNPHGFDTRRGTK